MGFFLKGILIGLLFGVPAGAVGAMTVQRTFQSGIRAGLVTGLGSSAADCFYACVGVFGLTIISDFLLRGQNIIHCAGGCLILAMGIGLLCKKDAGVHLFGGDRNRVKKESRRACFNRRQGIFKEDFRMFLSSFAVGIANPAAILTFLLAFSWFGISGKSGLPEGCLLVAGVFSGTYFWWGMLTAGTQLLKKKARRINLEKINRVFGIVLSILGLAVLVGALLEI